MSKANGVTDVYRDSIGEVTPDDIKSVSGGKVSLHVKIPCSIKGNYKNPAVDSSIKITHGENVEERLEEIQALASKSCTKCPNYSPTGMYARDSTTSELVYDIESNKCLCDPKFEGPNCNIETSVVAAVQQTGGIKTVVKTLGVVAVGSMVLFGAGYLIYSMRRTNVGSEGIVRVTRN